MCLCVSFPFGFEDGIWVSIVLGPNHCLSLYFLSTITSYRSHCLMMFHMISPQKSFFSVPPLSLEYYSLLDILTMVGICSVSSRQKWERNGRGHSNVGEDVLMLL